MNLNNLIQEQKTKAKTVFFLAFLILSYECQFL